MKRIIFTLYVLVSTLLSIQLKAQDTINIPKEKNLIVGLRTGVSIFDMHYSFYDMSIYDHKNGVREQFGAFVEYPDLWQNLSVRFSMLYFTRGVNLNRSKINYSLRSHYLDFRFPISYTFMRDKKYQPYIVFAPNINFALGGKIQYNYEYTHYHTKLSKANFRPVDISLFFGGGVKTPIKIENKIVIKIFRIIFVFLRFAFSHHQHDIKKRGTTRPGSGIVPPTCEGCAEKSVFLYLLRPKRSFMPSRSKPRVKRMVWSRGLVWLVLKT